MARPLRIERENTFHIPERKRYLRKIEKDLFDNANMYHVKT